MASDLPAIREIFEDERDALLVAPDDPTALASAVQRLLDEPQLGMRLGAAAKSGVAETTWQRRAENILAFAHTIGARTLNAAEEPTPPES